MGGTRRWRRGATATVGAVLVLAAAGCEARITETALAVHCTIDKGDPLAGIPAPEARTHQVRTWVTPATVAPGATVWVDIKFDDDVRGAFIVGPETTLALELPVPEGLQLTEAGVQDPEFNQGWTVDDGGSVLTVRYASPGVAPFLGTPRIRLTFTVTQPGAGAIRFPAYRMLAARRHYQGITESSLCAPDDAETTVATVVVADGESDPPA